MARRVVKRTPEHSSTQPRSVLIAVLLIAAGYLGAAYGPVYYEYISLRHALQNTAERCVIDAGERYACTRLARARAVDILGVDDSTLRVEAMPQQDGGMDITAEYARVVKPWGLSPRTLFFSIASFSPPPYRGFNTLPK